MRVTIAGLLFSIASVAYASFFFSIEKLPSTDSPVLLEQFIAGCAGYAIPSSVNFMEYGVYFAGMISPTCDLSLEGFELLCNLTFLILILTFISTSYGSRSRLFWLLMWACLLYSYPAHHLFRQSVAATLMMVAFYRKRNFWLRVVFTSISALFHLPVTSFFLVFFLFRNTDNIYKQTARLAIVVVATLAFYPIMIDLVGSRVGFVFYESESAPLDAVKLSYFTLIFALISLGFLARDYYAIFGAFVAGCFFYLPVFGFGEMFTFRMVTLFRYFLIPVMLSWSTSRFITRFNIDKSMFG